MHQDYSVGDTKSLRERHQDCIISAHDVMAKGFGGIGAFSHRHPWILFSIGLIVLVLICIGIVAQEKETELTVIWIEKGTDLIKQKEFYDAMWGGGDRLESSVMIRPDFGNILRSTYFQGFAETWKTVYLESETVSAYPSGTISVTNPDQISLQSNIGQVDSNTFKRYTVTDLCAALSVPVEFQQQDLPNGKGIYAFAYAKYTQCLRNQTSGALGTAFMNNISSLIAPFSPAAAEFARQTIRYGTGSPRTPLPDDWHVDRFPCLRGSFLDCFSDTGDFDYPLRLKQVQSMQAEIGFFSNAATFKQQFLAIPFLGPQLGSVYFDRMDQINKQCVGTALALIDPFVVNSNTNPTSNAQVSALLRATAQTTFTQILTLFTGAGYWWRQSVAGRSESSMLAFIDEAIKNAENKQVDASVCISKHFSNKLTKGLGIPLQGLGPSPYTSSDYEGLFSGEGAPCCFLFTGTKTTPELIFSQTLTRNATGQLVSMVSVRHNALLFNGADPALGARLAASGKLSGAGNNADNRIALGDDFEQVMIDYFSARWQKERDTLFGPGQPMSDVNFFFQMDRTANDVTSEGAGGEPELIIAGYAILIVYAALSLASIKIPYTKTNATYSRVLLSLGGIFCVGLSTLASFGLTAIVGEKVSVIAAGVVPFVSLAIGVDDMFVLAHTMIMFGQEADCVDELVRIKKTMHVAGPSVLLTSVANCCAFFIATLTPIPAVQSFMLQMGLSVILNFWSLITMFVPMLIWDIRRSNAKRSDICMPPCVSMDGPVPPEHEANKDSTGNFITDMTRKYLAPVMRNLIFKIILLAVSWAAFAILAWNAWTNTEKGLRLSDIALRGSYLRDFVDVNEIHFGAYSAEVVTRHDRGTNLRNVQHQLWDGMDSLTYKYWQPGGQWGPAIRNVNNPLESMNFPIPYSVVPRDSSFFGNGATTFPGFVRSNWAGLFNALLVEQQALASLGTTLQGSYAVGDGGVPPKLASLLTGISSTLSTIEVSARYGFNLTLSTLAGRAYFCSQAQAFWRDSPAGYIDTSNPGNSFHDCSIPADPDLDAYVMGEGLSAATPAERRIIYTGTDSNPLTRPQVVPITSRGGFVGDAPVKVVLFELFFQRWITSALGTFSLSSIICTDSTGARLPNCASYRAGYGHRILATRSTFYSRDLIGDDEPLIRSITVTRDNLAKGTGDVNGDIFVYGYVYRYWEQYVNIEENLYKVVGFSLLGVFLATLFLQFSPLTSLLVVVMILKIVIELYGTLDIIGAKLNAFSVVNLSMSVGMAVEFTAHISHVFLLRHGSRNERMCIALEEMMAPMVNGALSSFLAVLVLIFAKFPFFRVYYFGMFSLMILIAFGEGMIVMPVMLSLFGPRSFHYKAGEEVSKGSGIAMNRLGTNENFEGDNAEPPTTSI